MGGSWVEKMNDDREPAKMAAKNPFPVKNAGIRYRIRELEKFGIDSPKRRC